MQPKLQVHDQGYTLLQQLSRHLHDAELLAERLGLADLAANQKFWQVRVLQVQQQDVLLLLQQANAQYSSSATRQPGVPCQKNGNIDENEFCFQAPSSIDTSAPAAASCPSNSSPNSTVCPQLQPASQCQSLKPQIISSAVTETTQGGIGHTPQAEPSPADDAQQPHQQDAQQHTQQDHLVQQQQHEESMHLTTTLQQHAVEHVHELQQDGSGQEQPGLQGPGSHQDHCQLISIPQQHMATHQQQQKPGNAQTSQQQPEADALKAALQPQHHHHQQVPKQSHLQRALCVPAAARPPGSQVRDDGLEALLASETLLEEEEPSDAVVTVKHTGNLQQHHFKQHDHEHQHPHQQHEQQQQHQQQHSRQERRRSSRQQQQQALRGCSLTSPTGVAADQQFSGELCSHETSLLDTLAVAAAAVSQDPSAIEQPIDQLLSGHLQRPVYHYAAPGAAAAAAHLTPTAGVFLRHAAATTAAQWSRIAAAAAAGMGVVRAAHHIQQQYLLPTALYGPAAAAATSAPVHVLGKASAAAGMAGTHAAAAAAVVDSPNGSSTTAQDMQLEVMSVVAAEARGGGPYHKSSLLDLADQVGAAALAEAEAAASAGRRLSYKQLMLLMRPLEERLGDVLGMPVKAAPGLEVEEVRRMFFFNQHTAARHFGMCATTFKLLLRTVGIRYWPQRQFMAIVEALNFLGDKNPDSRDGSNIPGRMLVLHHAWWLLNSHPNLQLDRHPASAVKKAIHKQTFKERRREKRAACTLPGKGKRRKARTEATQPATAAPAAAEEAAEEEAAADEDAGSVAVAAAAPNDQGGGVKDVASQLYGALSVWPHPLQYLAEEAAEYLMLPPRPAPAAAAAAATNAAAPATAATAPVTATAAAVGVPAQYTPVRDITAAAPSGSTHKTAKPALFLASVCTTTAVPPAPAAAAAQLAPEHATVVTKVE